MLKKKLVLVLSLLISIILCFSGCAFDFMKGAINNIPPGKVETPLKPVSPPVFDDITQPDSAHHENIIPHLISKELRETEPVRYIDSVTETQVVTSAEELYSCLLVNKKPAPRETSEAETVYNEMIKVLNAIILNNMTEVERVHAIYDFIIYCVEYDYELFDKYLKDPSSIDRFDSAFTLTGVFVDRIAVCDGTSKAIAAMCKIEGIDSYQVKGTTNQGGHAWSKVKLHIPTCASADCIIVEHDAWYVIDPTYGNGKCTITDLNISFEGLSHAYFLIADSNPLLSEHKPDVSYTNSQKALYNYDYFKYLYIEFEGGKKLDLYIETQEEMNALYDSVVKANIMSFEFQIAFGRMDDYNKYLGIATGAAGLDGYATFLYGSSCLVINPIKKTA